MRLGRRGARRLVALDLALIVVKRSLSDFVSVVWVCGIEVLGLAG